MSHRASSHSELVLNCCAEAHICYVAKPGEITVTEKVPDYPPCNCMCLFTLSAVLEGIQSGSYDLKVYNEELDQVLFAEPVVIP